MSQRCALTQHSWKPVYTGWSNLIETEIEVHQLPALSQDSCKFLCMLFFHMTQRQLECGDVADACHH